MLIEVNAQPTYVYTGGKPLVPESVKQPVVLFIHGAQQDHSCWVLQSRWFAHHGFSVLAPDLPGHGRSGGPSLTSIEALSDWVVSLLDALGVAEASVVGHSMGSLVALQTAIAHGHRLTRAALLGSSLPMPVSPPLLEATRDNVKKAISMVNAFSFSSRSQIGGNRVPGLWHLGMNQRLMERQNPAVFHGDMSACNNYLPDPERLQTIHKPVLIVAGDQDRMTPLKAARALRERIPGAGLEVIQGSGHALMAERPDEVLDALISFIG